LGIVKASPEAQLRLLELADLDTELTRQDPSLLPDVLDLVRILARSGTAAMRARGRILLEDLEPSENPAKQRPRLRSDARNA